MKNEYLSKISDYIRENGVDCELREFPDSCHSVQEACKAADATPEEFVKSVCFISDGQLLVGIVGGNDRASTKRMARLLERDEVRLATQNEVMAMTGFPAGGVPPFGYDAVFLIDENVMERRAVWAGGGSDRALIKIRPQEIKRITDANVVRIRK
ncbi:MAG TPA: YbaK/EbsC family protein [Candidatus Methanofastidiosa archaeon]|nr:YbaK/EbsC family protein [Candidatus Methanofastidiosa archaeon]